MKTIEEQLEEYRKQGFNIFQMLQIRAGLLNNLDVTIYAKKEFNWLQMQEIRSILENKEYEKLEEYGFEKVDISIIVLES